MPLKGNSTLNLSYFFATRITHNEGSGFASNIMRLAIGTVALSVAVMILTNCLVSGFKNQIKNKVFDFWGHIQLTPPEYNQALEPEPLQLKTGLLDSIKQIKQVNYNQKSKANPFTKDITIQQHFTKGGIHHIQGFVQVPGIIAFGGQIEGLVLKGVDKNFDTTFINKYLISGRGNIYNDSTGRSILISQTTASRMKIRAGDQLIIHFVINGQQLPRKFKVEGIYKTGLEEYDRRFAICDINVLQQLLKWEADMYSGYEIFIDNLDDLPIINEYLYREILPENIYSTTIRNKFPGIFDWLQLQDYNEIVIIGLMVAVCLINMATVLIIFILNRLKMIGILKTLGMQNRKIGSIFLIQSARIILWGLLWGNIFGLGLAWLQYHFKFIKLNEADYYLAIAPIEFSFSGILIINLGVLVIVMLFLILPSWVVSRISPLKTITFN